MEKLILILILFIAGCSDSGSPPKTEGTTGHRLSVAQAVQSLKAHNIPFTEEKATYFKLGGVAPEGFALANKESLFVYAFSGQRVPHKAYQEFDKEKSSRNMSIPLFYQVKNVLIVYVHHAAGKTDGSEPQTEFGAAIKKAVEKLHGDEIEDVHGRLTNAGRWDEFVAKTGGGQSDRIRITRFTTEGDPIYHDVAYDGKRYEMSIDNSEDAFAGSGKGERTVSCSALEKQTGPQGTQYALQGCQGYAEPFTLIRLP